MGRPSEYDQAIADQILERLADGESLRAICAGDDMPHRSTVFRWLAANSEFRELYSYAREAQADAFADDVVAIADTPVMGTKRIRKFVSVAGGKDMGSTLEPVVERHTYDAVERSRLQIDARKWAAAKQAPKKYGDKLELSGNVRHEDALDELERLEEAARAAAPPPAES